MDKRYRAIAKKWLSRWNHSESDMDIDEAMISAIAEAVAEEREKLRILWDQLKELTRRFNEASQGEHGGIYQEMQHARDLFDAAIRRAP